VDIPLFQRTEFLPICQRSPSHPTGPFGVLQERTREKGCTASTEGLEVVHNAKQPLPNDEVYRVSVGCSGSIWGSTYGGGFVEILPGTDTIDASHVYGTNVGMVGVSNTSVISPQVQSRATPQGMS